VSSALHELCQLQLVEMSQTGQPAEFCDPPQAGSILIQVSIIALSLSVFLTR